MQPETAGEHTVAEGHLGHIAGHDARHLHEPSDALAPHIHIVFGVAHHHGLARGARRGMQLANLVHGHGEQAEREGVAQHGLVREGKPAHIVEGLDVGRRHAHLVHLLTVVRHALVGVGHRLLQLGELHSANLLTRRAFDLGLVDGKRVEAPSRCRGKGPSFGGHVEIGGIHHDYASFPSRSAM